MSCTATNMLLQSVVLLHALCPVWAEGLMTPPQKGQSSPLSAAVADDAYLPTEKPADKGLNETILQQLLLQIQNKSRPGYPQVHSLLLYKAGALVVKYDQPGRKDFIDFEQGVKVVKGQQAFVWTAEHPHYVALATKAVSATLVGLELQHSLVAQ